MPSWKVLHTPALLSLMLIVGENTQLCGAECGAECDEKITPTSGVPVSDEAAKQTASAIPVTAQDTDVDFFPPVKLVSLSQFAGPETEEPMAPAAVQFVKGLALVLLPETYTDDDDWAGTKKVQSGLNVKLKGFKLDTSRRWKEVNHGTWRRVDATLVDPKQHFDLAISLLPRIERGVPRYRVRAKLRLRATGRQQHWSLGAKLLSISSDIVADVAFDADLQFKTQVVKTDGASKLRMIPYVERANARLDSFSVRRISNTKGGAVREFGKAIESIARRAIKKKNPKLAAKINGKINKKPERFEVPAGILAVFGEEPDASVLEAAESKADTTRTPN